MFVIYLDCFDPSLKDVLDLSYASGKQANNNHYCLLGAKLCAELMMNILSLNSHKHSKWVILPSHMMYEVSGTWSGLFAHV